MITTVEEACNIARNLEEYSDCEITKAYKSEDDGELFFSFIMKQQGMEDIPGMTSFMVSVFDDGTVATGNGWTIPPGGKEIPVPAI